MKKHYKTKKLFATVAVAALALGISSSPAKAFENVGWDWNLNMNGEYNTMLELELDLVPAGLIVMEKTQLQIGDVTAESIVSDIQNNPPSGSDGFVQIDETFTFNTDYDDDQDPGLITATGPVAGNQLDGNLVGGGVDEGDDSMEVTFQAVGEVYVPTEEALDGIDLPSVESAATAVGNNQTIETTTALQLHDGQFLIGGLGEDERGDLFSGVTNDVNSEDDSLQASGNFHTDMMVAMLSGGLSGLVEPATISANSSVSNITNASIDSAATAVGNNMDVQLDAVTNADALMLADIHQASYADILATSTVENISVTNYGNLGALEGPLVNSVATAVGNNFSLKLTEPDPDL